MIGAVLLTVKDVKLFAANAVDRLADEPEDL